MGGTGLPQGPPLNVSGDGPSLAAPQGCPWHGAVALTVRTSRSGQREVMVAEQRAHRRTSTADRVQAPARGVTDTFRGKAEAWGGKGRVSPPRPLSPSCCHLPGCTLATPPAPGAGGSRESPRAGPKHEPCRRQPWPGLRGRLGDAEMPCGRVPTPGRQTPIGSPEQGTRASPPRGRWHPHNGVQGTPISGSRHSPLGDCGILASGTG